MLILLTEYAKNHDRTPNAMCRKAARGGFKTAVKIGRDWFIDDSEPLTDHRVKTGDYVGWRKKSET